MLRTEERQLRILRRMSRGSRVHSGLSPAHWEARHRNQEGKDRQRPVCAGLGSPGEWACPMPDTGRATQESFQSKAGENQSKHITDRRTQGGFTHPSLRLGSNRTAGVYLRTEAHTLPHWCVWPPCLRPFVPGCASGCVGPGCEGQAPGSWAWALSWRLCWFHSSTCTPRHQGGICHLCHSGQWLLEETWRPAGKGTDPVLAIKQPSFCQSIPKCHKPQSCRQPQ